jgi:hypothetical protein
MGRFTVRLPDTLHRQIKATASEEGISMNQYIVYALTRQIMQDYTVHPVPEAEKERQQRAYAALLERLGQATFDEIEAALEEREEGAPEEDLAPEVVARVQKMLESSRQQEDNAASAAAG